MSDSTTSAAAQWDNNKYAVNAAFIWAWAKFRVHWKAIIKAMIVYAILWIIITLIVDWGTTAITGSSSPLSFRPGEGFVVPGLHWNFGEWVVYAIGSIIMSTYSFMVSIGLICAGLKIANGEKLEYKDLFPTDKGKTVIIAAWSVGIASGIGYMLFLVPGLLIAFFSAFFLFFIFDNDMTSFQSIRASWKFVFQHLIRAIILLIASAIVMVIGALICLVGLLVAIPLIYLAQVYFFRKLNGQNVPIEAANYYAAQD